VKEVSSIPCVAYAAKSSPDEKDSTGTQLAEVRDAVRRATGREVIREFSEENVSGFKGERGAKLTAAIAAAEQAAATYGEAELWVWHSSRLARGDGTRGRRSLLKVYADLLYEGVRLRSVNDDEFVRNSMLVGIASEQNNKYSRDLSAWVTGGKDRQMREGRFLGGPAPDGLRRVVTLNEHGQTQTHYERDEARATIILRAFELSDEGKGDGVIGRILNAEGSRTQAGRTWTRRRVQDTLTNPVYAGRVVRHRGKPNVEVTTATNLPALIEGNRFDAIQRARGERDRAAEGRARARAAGKGGRPTGRYALSKLATCEACDSPMYCVTSPYKRKDGSQARHYVCREVRDGTGVCNAPPVPAETADAAIVPHLRGFFVDFEAWVEQVTSAETADRDALAAQLAGARATLGKLKRAETGAQDRYATALAEDDELKVNALEAALTRFAAERKQAGSLVDDLAATLEEASDTSAPTDRLLDFWNELSASIRGKLDSAQTLADVNERLREVLHSVRIETLPDGRVRLLAIFEDHDEWWTDEMDVSADAPPLYPNTLVAVGGDDRPRRPIPTRPTETGRNSQE
jgi:hypothetical protein